MAATHHSQLNDAVFSPSPASFPWERREEAVRPNQTGSYRVHNLQVGPSSSREMFVHVRLIGPSGPGHTLVVLRNSYQQIGEF